MLSEYPRVIIEPNLLREEEEGREARNSVVGIQRSHRTTGLLTGCGKQIKIVRELT